MAEVVDVLADAGAWRAVTSVAPSDPAMKVAVVCLEVNRPGSWVQAAVTVQAWALLEDPTLAVPHQATECRLQTLASRDRCVSRAISTSREARQSGECSTRSGRAATCHVTAVSARHQFLLNQ